MTKTFAKQIDFIRDTDTPIVTGDEESRQNRPLLDLPYSFALEYGTLIVADHNQGVKIVLRDGSDPLELVKIQRYLALPFELETSDEAGFQKLLKQHYPAASNLERGPSSFRRITNNSNVFDDILSDIKRVEGEIDNKAGQPSLRLIYGIIAEPMRKGASAIHMESGISGLIIKVRIDGTLTEKLRFSADLAAEIITRMKKMAGLLTSEQIYPQNGLLKLTISGKLHDVQISTLPCPRATDASERIVLRIIRQDSAPHTFDLPGMSEQTGQTLMSALSQPDGLILFAGPSGSGKTTALYSAIQKLNNGKRNILTIENPIQHAIKTVGQTPVNSATSLDYAAMLEAVVCQDPDIIVLDGISDQQTTRSLVDASLNRRLVLLTVNADNAVKAITHLRDMHVDPFLLANSLQAVISQRLVRKLCEHCRKPIQADGSLASLLGFDRGTVVFRENGCKKCDGTGFQGYIGVYEAIHVDDIIRKLINNDGNEGRIAAHAFLKTKSLASAARVMVRNGTTTAEEGIKISKRGQE